MTLVKFRNNNLLGSESMMPSIFSNLFNDYFTGDVMPRSMRITVPACNIHETEHNFAIELAAPGLQKSDFYIEIENGVLNISAENKDEKKDENLKYTRREFSYASFKRTFTLPESVNPDGISAAYENGVLSLTLPKREESKIKPVKEVKVS